MNTKSKSRKVIGGSTSNPWVIHPYYTGRDKGPVMDKDNKVLEFFSEGDAWHYIFFTLQPDDDRAKHNYKVEKRNPPVQVPKGFPLSGLFREVAEGQLEEAERHLDIAEEDVRLVMRGQDRSGYFKAETDPVKILVQAAQQVELCKVVLKLDDEARGLDPWDKETT